MIAKISLEPPPLVVYSKYLVLARKMSCLDDCRGVSFDGGKMHIVEEDFVCTRTSCGSEEGLTYCEVSMQTAEYDECIVAWIARCISGRVFAMRRLPLHIKSLLVKGPFTLSTNICRFE